MCKKIWGLKIFLVQNNFVVQRKFWAPKISGPNKIFWLPKFVWVHQSLSWDGRSIPYLKIHSIKYEPPYRPRTISKVCCGGWWWWSKWILEFRFVPNLRLRHEAGTKLNNEYSADILMRWNRTRIKTETLALTMKLWLVHSQCNLFYSKGPGTFADQVIEIQDADKTSPPSARVAAMRFMLQQNCKRNI